MPNSYAHHQSSRPSQYRTPSPPWDAVEPISPIITSFQNRKSTDRPLLHVPPTKSLQTQPVRETIFPSPEHRSNGSMEIFAEIALSAQLPKRDILSNHSSKRSLSGPDITYSPSKRSRSEKLPSPELPKKSFAAAMRPATSYEHTSKRRMMDAELLLNFSLEARLACSSSKASSPHTSQQFFSQRREKISDISSSQPFRRHKRESFDAINTTPPSNESSAEPVHSTVPEYHGGMTAVSPVSISRELQSKTVPLNSERNLHIKTPEDIPRESTMESSLMRARNSGSSRAAASIAKNERASSQSRPSIPNSFTKELGSNKSSGIDGAMVNALSKKAVIDSRLEDTRTADNLRTGIEEKKPQQSDTAVNTEAVENEKFRSGAFCASCKFERNLSCVELENSATSWISCDGCKAWFHFACAGFKNEREVRAVDKFRCKSCKPLYGATTYVRKSSRAHSAIDYAGLHQGVIKTSDERMEHHYIQPIKDGIITFLPENFARMRAELVTAEFFERNGGMKEPVIVPADFNPRPPLAPTTDSVTIEPYAGSMEMGNIATDLDGSSEHHIVPNEGQDALDMVIPQGLTVRQVAELYGPEEKVEVIDVKSQNGENRKWNMRRWADYYENPSNKVVRNVISLEVSQSKLGRLIRRPKIVRDLDLQDSVWPEDLLAKGEYPHVQFYCLMSVADCFTDFHIDFGGSSVFYHILRGKKTFLFIPPKEKHLKKYEEWCMSPAQNWTFLADQTKECYRVDLSAGDTMLIPSGWIHAVWTPEDSLVIGGNFMTRLNYGMQLRVAQVEKATGVARKFRYPYFQKLHWYAAFRYMEEDPLPDDLKEELYQGGKFFREQPIYYDFDAWGENSRSGKRNYNARYYSQWEIEGLRDLTAYLLRTALIDLGYITDGITAETRNAVKKSIPRGHGEPLDVVKNFAAWCTWKRGNELLHHWAYPDANIEDCIPPEKLSMATMKQLDREAAREAALQAPRRQSTRKQSLEGATLQLPHIEQSSIPSYDTPTPSDNKGANGDDNAVSQIALDSLSEVNKKRKTPSSAGSGLNRKTACEACRKRRRACKHKDQVVPLTPKHNVHNVHSQKLDVGTQLNTHVTPDNIADSSINGVIVVVPQGSVSSTHQDDDAIYESTDQPQDRSEEPFNKVECDQSKGSAPTPGNTGLSRPRTKACNDCRRSKRRCIHDAFGNEDPVKVAEQVIPRPHARKSHKSTNSRTLSSCLADEQVRSEEQSNSVAPIAKMTASSVNGAAILQPTAEQHSVISGGQAKGGSLSYEPPVPVSHMSLDTALDTAHVSGNQSITKSVVMGVDIQLDTRASTSEVLAPERLLPPSSTLISPPASSNDDVGSSPINGATIYSPSPPPSRQLPNQAGKESHQECTPESGSLRRASSSSYEQRRHDSGHCREKFLSTPALANELGTTQKSVADEESLRLIRQLQVQDYGLRKRGKF